MNWYKTKSDWDYSCFECSIEIEEDELIYINENNEHQKVCNECFEKFYNW